MNKPDMRRKHEKAKILIDKLRKNIDASAKSNEEYAITYADIPLAGRTIFEQQRLLYQALIEWLDKFEKQFIEN